MRPTARSLIALGLTLGLSIPTQDAQAEERILLSGGRSQLRYDATGLNQFTTSFEAVEGGALTQGFGPLGLAAGPRVDLGYAHVSDIGLACFSTLGFARYSESADATYQDGAWRELDLEIQDLTAGVEVGYLGEHTLFTVLMEFSARQVALESDARRPDGTPNTSDDLVGRYQTRIDPLQAIGASIGVGSDPIYLVLRWTRPVAWIPAGYLYDTSPYKAEQGSAYFPTDYAAFQAGSTPGRFNAVYGGDFVGQTLSLNLVILAPVK